MNKKQIRSEFRKLVFKRDNYTCRACGKKYSLETAEENLDAHHITNRNDVPNGGYVKENGVSLCKHGNPSCHEKAEANNLPGFSKEELYAKIGSSYELAYQASSKAGLQPSFPVL